MFTDEVLRDMVGSGEVVAEIEREWEQLLKDRACLRQIFPKGGSKVRYIYRKSRNIYSRTGPVSRQIFAKIRYMYIERVGTSTQG